MRVDKSSAILDAGLRMLVSCLLYVRSTCPGLCRCLHRVYLLEHPVEEVDDYEGVLLLVGVAESHASVHVLYHEEIKDRFNFLGVGYVMFFPLSTSFQRGGAGFFPPWEEILVMLLSV